MSIAKRVASRYKQAAKDWGDAQDEVPDLTRDAQSLHDDLETAGDNVDELDLDDEIEVAQEIVDDLENAEVSEQEDDLWANLQAARKKAETLQNALKRLKSKARKEPDEVKDGINDALGGLKQLVRGLDVLIP